MDCYICSAIGRERPSALICRHCRVGVCLDHLAQSVELGPGGLRAGCGHDLAGQTSGDRSAGPVEGTRPPWWPC